MTHDPPDKKIGADVLERGKRRRDLEDEALGGAEPAEEEEEELGGDGALGVAAELGVTVPVETDGQAAWEEPPANLTKEEADEPTQEELDAIAAEVLAGGGLHVILCQLNASPRIDRQFLGRSGRQGQPGSC